MRKKLVTGAVVTVLLVVTLGGAALALGPWGEATEDPPCAKWNERVFDAETGKIRLPETDDNGKGVGFSLTAARGLLDESACAWVFRPDDDTNVYWAKRYSLEVLYDAFVAQWAVERSRYYPVESLIHVGNDDPEKVISFEAECENGGGEVWKSGDTGLSWCNFRSSNGSITGVFNFNDGDYVIRGPR